MVLTGMWVRANIIHFWQDVWHGKEPFQTRFSLIYAIAKDKNSLIKDVYRDTDPFTWNMVVTRYLQDWELQEYENLLQLLFNIKLNSIMTASDGP